MTTANQQTQKKANVLATATKTVFEGVELN